MSAENNGSINWGAVVISLAIIGFTAFALYLTHSLWSLLALFFLCYSGNLLIRPAKEAPKKCCGGKKCCGEDKPCGGGPDCGGCNGC